MPASEESTDSAACRADLPGFNGKVNLAGCSRALASLSWVWNKSSGQSHFLFATIDLVPDELPLVDCPPARKPVDLGKKSEWRVYSSHDEVKSSDGVEWYDRFVTSGEWAAPWLDPAIKKATIVSDILNEPRWPEMIKLENCAAVPFASARSAGTRAHHTISTGGALRSTLVDKEVIELTAAAKRVLHVDLDQSPHLWQSAHFFMPRPVLRHLSSRLDSGEGSGDRAILLNLVPRQGARIEGLTVEILEKRPTGTRLLTCARPTSMFVRVPLNEEVEEIAIRAVHDEYGLLLEEGPYAFLRGMNLQLITEHRRVTLPERKNRPAETHKIPLAGMGEKVLTGSERGLSASSVLRQATVRRSTAASPPTRQMWFRDNPLAAEREVRRIIGAAKTRLLLVDPYFTEVGVRLYLPWVTGSAVENEILTSSGALRGISVEGESEGEDEEGRRARRELSHLTALSYELDRAFAARQINVTRVKVMQGKRPPIHDRFLVVDESVWLLGSSLNEFGTRGTMMVELPVPSEVVPELVEVWDSSPGLRDRIEILRGDLGERA